MKKLLALLFLLLPLGGMAQTADADVGVLYRYYDEGPLTFDDFYQTYGTGEHASYMNYGYTHMLDTIRLRNCSPILRVIPRIWMIPSESWMLFNHTDSATLRYNQVVFDIAEKYARTLNRQMNGNPGMAPTQTLNDLYIGKLQREVTAFKEASREGQDTAVVAEYAERTQKALADLPATMPAWQPVYSKGWSLGMWIGWGTSFAPAEVTQCITAPQCYDIGFNNLFDRSRLFFDLLCGFCHARKPFVMDGKEWFDDTRFTYVKGTAAYGYAVVDNDFFALVPYVGAYFSVYSYTLDYDDPSSSVDMYHNGLTAGVEAEWKFRRTHSEAIVYESLYGGSYSRHNIMDWYLKARLSFDSPVFEADVPGNNLCLTLALGFDARNVHKKFVNE